MLEPSGQSGSAVHLDWDGAIDKNQNLQKCPVCGCGELFIRKDFPQRLGLALVMIAAAVALVLFAVNLALWAFGVLGAMTLIDLCVYLLTGRCLVCYRCRSEFRHLPIGPPHRGWDLSTGEKYRQLGHPDDGPTG